MKEFQKVLIGIVGMAIFSVITWLISSNIINGRENEQLKAKIDLIQVRVEENSKLINLRIDDVIQDRAVDEDQEEILKRHWKLHGWARDEINTLRSKNNMEAIHWPGDN